MLGTIKIGTVAKFKNKSIVHYQSELEVSLRGCQNCLMKYFSPFGSQY